MLFTDLFQRIYTAVDILALLLVFLSACILSAGINSRYVSQFCWVPFSSPAVMQKGGRGCLISPSCLKSQGYHLIPLSYRVSSSCTYSCNSFCLVVLFFVTANCPPPRLFFQETLQYVLLRNGLFVRVLLSSWEKLLGRTGHPLILQIIT